MGPHWGSGGTTMSWGGSTGLGIAPFWTFLLFVLGTVAIIGIGYLVYSLLGSHREEPPADALALLRQRYARGEIDDEEFDRRMTRLTS